MAHVPHVPHVERGRGRRVLTTGLDILSGENKTMKQTMDQIMEDVRLAQNTFRNFLHELFADISSEGGTFTVTVDYSNDFKTYIFTRRKDKAQIPFVVIFNIKSHEVSELHINGNILPPVFLSSQNIRQDLVKICRMADDILYKIQLKKSLDFIMPIIKEFFEEAT